MSNLIALPAPPQIVVEPPAPVVDAVVAEPVFISTQAVAFSTAAAVPIPRTTSTSRMLAALRAMFLTSSTDAQPTPRHYPSRRESFMEAAAMSREMYRL